MLVISIPAQDLYDEMSETFITLPARELELEHSLIAMSKWESKWMKPFLGKEEKTNEEVLDYVRCMTISRGVPPEVYSYIPGHLLGEINEYIASGQTATTFREYPHASGNAGKTITAEVIYGWMVSLNIPFECQKWHINRLIALVRVCQAQNGPQKKMSRREIMAQNRELNKARQQKYNTHG